nr:integrase, catalytic region, zinc finger, CCHC-type, peptidase aspartic, catalytic [Tanacetum cinerariifolium]
APQKQLTPEQIYWSNDLIKLKSEALKEQAKVFSVVIKSELNVAQFTEMHVANTSVEAHCLALEAELATLCDKSHQENQGELIKHFSKLEELLEYAIGTCPQGSQQRAKQLANTPLIRKKQVTISKPSDKQDRVTSYPKASGSPPKSNLRTNRISPAKGCSKHMTGDRSRLLNFMKKFIGTVRFGNDHFGAIMGYGDYVVGESVISRVYYVEGLGHNLFSVRQFCDSDLKVAFRKHSCYVRDTDGVDLIKGSRGSNLYTISVEDMMKSSPICLLSKASKNKSWLWHRQLEILFQPMFDEYLEPPWAKRPSSPAQVVQAPVTSAGTPLSTTIDQDAPSPHISPLSSALQSHSLPLSVVAEPYFIEDHNVAPVDNNPFVNVFALEPHSEASSLGDISSTKSPYVSQSLHHLNKWSNDHPLDNVISNPSRPVSTRKQLATDALWCLYSFVLSKIEPKNFKSAIIKDCCFQAMQDEIHEFDRLQVWELVSQ